MKLEDMVCSLESAHKLKELGVKQESLFYWSKLSGYEALDFIINYKSSITIAEECDVKLTKVAAFTAAELVRCLPLEIKVIQTTSDNTWKEYLLIEFNSIIKKYKVAYVTHGFHDPIRNIICKSENEAEAIAKSLIYLLQPPSEEAYEANLRIDLTYVNERIT